MTSDGDHPLVGLFVGGRSRRMGGAPKALLSAPDAPHETLLDRTVRIVHEVHCELVFVGDAPWLGSRHATVPRVRDVIEDAGPLAGLAALMREGARRGHARVIALACDLPFVDAPLVRRLCVSEVGAAVLAPAAREREAWDALFARYECARVGPVVDDLLRGSKRAMQSLFDRVAVTEFVVSDEERRRLRDWDAPGDVTAG